MKKTRKEKEKRGRLQVLFAVVMMLYLTGVTPIRVWADVTEPAPSYGVTVYNTVSGSSSTTEQGGTIIGDGYYQEGDTVTLVATPNAGYCAIGWVSSDSTVADLLPSGVSPEHFTISFTMPAQDVEITGFFRAHNPSYEDLGDGTHIEKCFFCGQTQGTEKPHEDGDGDEFCDACGCNVHVHTYGEYHYDESGYHWRGCTTCGDTYADYSVHSFSTDWSCDKSGHYHVCVCGMKKGEASHTSSGVATVEKAETCTICGYEIAPKISIGTRFDFNFLKYEITGPNTAKVVGCADGEPTGGQRVVSKTASYQGLDFTVTEIGEDAFRGWPDLISIVVADTVKTIGKNAFIDCKRLEKVTLGSGLEIIGEGAFRNCLSLTKITLPESLTRIEMKAFFDCKALVEIVIPDSVRSIGRDGFAYCEMLTKVVFGKGIEELGEGAFYTCPSLKEITLPASITTMGTSVFSRCYALESVTLCDGLTQLSAFTFYDCSSLKEITIPGSITRIGNGAFSNCKGLQSVTLQEGIEVMGADAFRECDALSEITLPASMTKIEGSAFMFCDNLSSVTLNEGLEIIEDKVFGDCVSLTEITIPYTVTRIGDNAFQWVKEMLQTAYIQYIGEEPTVEIMSGAFCDTTKIIYVPMLNKPTNLRWEGTMAMWDAVEGAEQYEFKVYWESNGICVRNKVLGAEATSYDIGTSYSTSGAKLYFTVKAISGDIHSPLVKSDVATAGLGGGLGYVNGNVAQVDHLAGTVFILSGNTLSPGSVSDIDLTELPGANSVVVESPLLNVGGEFHITTGDRLGVTYSSNAWQDVLGTAGTAPYIKVDTQLVNNRITLGASNVLALEAGEYPLATLSIDTYALSQFGNQTYIPVNKEMEFDFPVDLSDVPENARIRFLRVNEDKTRDEMPVLSVANGVARVKTDGNSDYVLVYELVEEPEPTQSTEETGEEATEKPTEAPTEEPAETPTETPQATEEGLPIGAVIAIVLAVVAVIGGGIAAVVMRGKKKTEV